MTNSKRNNALFFYSAMLSIQAVHKKNFATCLDWVKSHIFAVISSHRTFKAPISASFVSHFIPSPWGVGFRVIRLVTVLGVVGVFKSLICRKKKDTQA